jgi:hypothetical protein
VSIRRSLLGLASLTVLVTAGMAASSGAQGGPCSPSTPEYCPPPHVTTSSAKHVTSTSATLTGTVNPNGSVTTCDFEYGRTKAYGSTTPVQHLGSGTKSVQVSATVSGLRRRTVYHYQLVCKNLGGPGTGGDRTFKTHGLPKKAPTVKTGRTRGKNRRITSATLLGTVTPNGSSTTCRFQYGRTKNYGSHTPTKSVGSGTKSVVVKATVRGLRPKTVYHDELVCQNVAGRRKGGDRRFETLNQIVFRGSASIRVSRKGKFAVALHCDGNSHCVGFLTLIGSGGKRLSDRVRYTIRSHTTGHVKLTLTSAALTKLKHRHHLAGQLRSRNLDGSTTTRRVHLKR